MSDCLDRPTLLPEALWKALMNLPALRYMKAPVDNVPQLYEKYPIGNEKGAFAFVHNENSFYSYHPRGFNRGEWKPIGGGLSTLFEIIETTLLKDGDVFIWDFEKGKFVIINLSLWGTEEY